MTKPKIKRLVIKVGSSTVTDSTGRLDHANIASLVKQISSVWSQGIDCVLVTSGAIAAGVEELKLKKRPAEISKLQAAAAVGQGLLVHEYTRLFREHEIKVAQILLTRFDMAHRELYVNARLAMDRLLTMRVLPIVNENDTTAVEEIKFGDNDTLAALASVLIEAGVLVILSDIDGLYESDPRKSTSAPNRRIKVVDEITPEIESVAEGIGSSFGSGGMLTKINAAKLVGAAQIGMYIADGRDPDVLAKIISGAEIGTYFKPNARRVPGKKLWIGFGRAVRGRVIIDDGAVTAITDDGRSLLPAGVIGLEGDFAIGDTIEVVDTDGKVIARGLVNYSAVELEAVRGKRTGRKATGISRDIEEVIHRDYMMMI